MEEGGLMKKFRGVPYMSQLDTGNINIICCTQELIKHRGAYKSMPRSAIGVILMCFAKIRRWKYLPFNMAAQGGGHFRGNCCKGRAVRRGSLDFYKQCPSVTATGEEKNRNSAIPNPSGAPINPTNFPAPRPVNRTCWCL